MMNPGKRITVFFASLLLATLTGLAHAATASYAMDQSGVLPDGVRYLTVTLSDNVGGQLDFWVSTESPLSDAASDNFGIQSFAFNLIGDLLSKPAHHHDFGGDEYPGNETAVEHRGFEYPPPFESRGEDEGYGEHGALDALLTADSFILPEGWDVQFNKGKVVDGVREEFDVRLLGDAGSRQDPLHFSVLGLTLDDILGEFDALVAGFEFPNDECDGEFEQVCEPITRAGFYGDTLIEEPVVTPLPASLWLLGSGLLGLVGVAQRGKRRS